MFSLRRLIDRRRNREGSGDQVGDREVDVSRTTTGTTDGKPLILPAGAGTNEFRLPDESEQE